MGFDWDEILGDGDLQELYDDHIWDPEDELYCSSCSYGADLYNLPCTTAILPYFANGGDIGDEDDRPSLYDDLPFSDNEELPFHD